MNIKPTGLVLEIGSGDNPNPRSDVLCDRFITTNRERAGGFRIRIDRPLVVADGMRLPFADNTFDYVIASHIFEHMDDPAGFAREIARVGKAGYIEVPSALSERVFGWNFHHWYCELDGGTLTLTPKKEGERWGGFFHRFIARELWFRRFFEEHEQQWYTRLAWQGNIPICVVMSPMNLDASHELDERAWMLLANAKPEVVKDLIFRIRFFLRRVLRKTRKTIRQFGWWATKRTRAQGIIASLVKHCVCPRCHGKLGIHGEKLTCSQCRMNFSIDGVIPILLAPEERKKGY